MNKFLKLKFSVLQILFWCGFTSIISFAVSYFSEKGISASIIGITVSIATLSTFLGQFFWGYLADKIRSNKKVFIITCTLAIAFSFLTYYMNSITLIIITYALLNFVFLPTAANLDGWILKVYHETPQVYGFIRSWAALFSAFFSLLYGILIKDLGYSIMPIFVTVFMIMAIALAVFITDAPASEKQFSKPSKQEDNAFKELFSSKKFIYFTVVMFFIGLASAPLMPLVSMIIESVNGSVEYVGYTISVACIVQFPFMALAAKFKWISPLTRILIAAFANLIGIIFMATASSPIAVLVGFAFNGMWFGLVMPAIRESAFALAPKKLQTTAIGTIEAISMSLTGIIATFAGGYIIDSFSVQVLLIITGTLQLIPIALLLLNRMKKPLKNN